MSTNEQFLYVLRPSRVEMLSDATAQEEEAVGRHLQYLQQQAAEGIVLMAGRTLDSGADTMGLVVLEAGSMDAARQIMEADPGVSEGVMTATLYPYRVAVTGGAFAGGSG
jgi:uncharacterized protein YciI